MKNLKIMVYSIVLLALGYFLWKNQQLRINTNMSLSYINELSDKVANNPNISSNLQVESNGNLSLLESQSSLMITGVQEKRSIKSKVKILEKDLDLIKTKLNLIENNIQGQNSNFQIILLFFIVPILINFIDTSLNQGLKIWSKNNDKKSKMEEEKPFNL